MKFTLKQEEYDEDEEYVAVDLKEKKRERKQRSKFRDEERRTNRELKEDSLYWN